MHAAQRRAALVAPQLRLRLAVASAMGLIALAIAVVALLGAAPHGAGGAPPQTQGQTPRLALADLPAAAQAGVSSTLGAHDARYAVEPAPGGYSAASSPQRLTARFSAAGADIRIAGMHVGLSLRAIAWDGAGSPLAAAAPQARGNVVTFAHRGVLERWANGPLGLEQSFLVAAPATHAPARTLSLALSLVAGRAPVLGAGGRGLVFGRGGGAPRYAGLSARDAGGRQLHSWLTLGHGRVTIHVATRGARFPVQIDPFVQQGPKLSGGEESGEGEAGAAAALSADGNTAIVGGPGDGADAGAAWVFTRSGSTWSQQGPKLTPSGEAGAGRFGFSVSLSGDGNTAFVGAPLDNGGVGAAWVFKRSGTTWEQQGGKLTGGGEESGKGEFGIAVKVSADAGTALVGASADSSATGAVWAFTQTETGWEQQGPKLTGAGESGQARFGFSLALSEEGTTALIGGGSDNAGTGAAWVFVRSGSSWEQQGAKLTGTGETGAGHLGFSSALSASGDTALVGGVADNGETGAAWVFVRSGTSWAQQGAKLTGAGESGTGLFGSAVALSADGNSALVGGSADATHVGAAWVFTRSEAAWTQLGSKLTGGEESGKGEFGSAAALAANGETGLVGGRDDNSGAGAAWAFVRLPQVPVAVTGAASGIIGGAAQLNGTVNPNGKTVTNCHFDYGPTTEYGSTVPCSTLPGSGNSPVAVSAAVTGLSANTTYHFRLVATNADGTGEGADQQFTTGNPPEFGRCVKLAKGVHGGFGTATCTTAATATKFGFEWEPGPGPSARFTAAIKPTTTAVLETVTKRKVECTGAHAEGEYTGRKTLGGVVIALTGCVMSGEKCTSAGATEGEVRTSTLEGLIGIEKTSPEGPLKNKVALDLAPPGGSGPVTEFSCGATSVVVEGSVLSPMTVNKMLTKDNVKFAATAGKQKPEKLEGLPADVLSASFSGEPFVQIGLKVLLVRVNEQPIETSTVL